MWKPISDNYECSDDGHIRNRKTQHVLKEFDSCHDGYLRTQFDGKTQTIHRVVAKTFIPIDPNRPFVNHKDGNKKNNAVDNLEWCTRSENIRHAYDNGLNTGCGGTKNGHCRLTLEQVNYIRENYRRGDKEYGGLALANKFGVAHQTISAVACGQTWSKIKKEDD